MDELKDAWELANRDQIAAAFRNLAEVFGECRSELIKAGFSEKGAEHITETIAVLILEDA